MNIALTTLVFLFFLLPGFLFRRLYYSGEFSNEYFKENLFSLVFPTDFFVIPFSQILNLHISYYRINPPAATVEIPAQKQA